MNKTNSYDDEFFKFSHYSSHPQMIPFVGQFWNIMPKKLLVLGESHYLPKDSDKNIIENWYSINDSNLSALEKCYTNTAEMINEAGHFQKYKYKGHGIWKNIELAILESGFRPSDTSNMFKYISFMNFFQRPAMINGESIIPNEQDLIMANKTLDYVISILKPDFIFFTTSKSWYRFNKDLFDINFVGHSSHPTSKWWNRKCKSYTNLYLRDNLTGKESFVDFIKYNGIFDSVNL